MKPKKTAVPVLTALLMLSFALAGCTGCAGFAAEKKEEEKTTLIMATNAEFPPYEFYEDGGIVGIDAEIAQAIADDLGLELVIDDMKFDSIIASVQSGIADIGVAGLTVDDEKLAKVNFSVPYHTTAQVLIVREDSGIAALNDLSGKKVGVQLGTTGDEFATENIVNAEVERYNMGAEAVQALEDGEIDAVMIDREPANVFAEENKGLKVIDDEYTTENYAIAVKKGNDELLNDINDSLTRLKASGRIDGIINKYITEDR